MALTVLSVAYPLAPVSPDAAGGAEQVLSTLDRGLVEAGHRSLVIAQEGSDVAGTLLPVPRPVGLLDAAAQAAAQERHRSAIAAALREGAVDVVHMHGIDFAAYLPAPGPPVLATLHLPPDWYGADALRPQRPDTWLHCVSAAQDRACPPLPNLLDPIENGVDVEALGAVRYRRRSYALVLGRICREKGTHLAIEAAHLAGVPLLIAGGVFPYRDHLRYFDREVAPRLGPGCRFVGPVGFRAKRRLLSSARCLLVPSLAQETSSLVAREAIACGTAVVAFPNGALQDAVADGLTGFLVADVAAMAAAIGRVGAISAEECRRVARERFSDRTMIAAYLALYGRLASARRP